MPQKNWAWKTIDKIVLIINALYKIPLFTYLIATLFSYHEQKIGMIFMC